MVEQTPLQATEQEHPESIARFVHKLMKLPNFACFIVQDRAGVTDTYMVEIQIGFGTMTTLSWSCLVRLNCVDGVRVQHQGAIVSGPVADVEDALLGAVTHFRKVWLKATKLEIVGVAAQRADGSVVHAEAPARHDALFARFPEIADAESRAALGFITAGGKFVDRAEAARIAYAGDQLKYPQIHDEKAILISEDLW